jgi:hypothetical protein
MEMMMRRRSKRRMMVMMRMRKRRRRMRTRLVMISCPYTVKYSPLYPFVLHKPRFRTRLIFHCPIYLI